MNLLFWLAASTLVSEDLACIGAGVAVATGALSFPAAAGACTAGIFVGDLLLYAAGRWAHRWIPDRWCNSPAAAWIEWRCWAAVLISRFTPGLRLPVYVGAGVLRISLPRFALWLAVAALL